MNYAEGWCHHCQRLTCIKQTEYEKEDVVGNTMTTREFLGKCRYCDRVLRKVVVDVTEGQNGE